MAIVVMQIQLHQFVRHVCNYHHCEYSLFKIGLMFVVSFGEWFKTLLGFLEQSIWP
jgi:hypothetical protein